MRHVKTSLSLTQKAEIDTLVKKANQRLRELEKQGYTKERAYQMVAHWDYRQAKFMTKTKNGQMKFRTDTAKMYKADPKSYYDLKARVSEFLGLNTSKVSEIKKYHAKGARTFKQRYGIELSDTQLKDIFGSDLWEEMSNQYGSDTLIDVVQKTENKKAEDMWNILQRLKEGESIGAIEDSLLMKDM